MNSSRKSSKNLVLKNDFEIDFEILRKVFIEVKINFIVILNSF